MAARRRSDDQPPPPVIRVAGLGELKAYVVQEHELEILARGSPGSILLNFACALLPLAFTAFATLLTTTSPLPTFVVFVCTGLISLLVGLICLVVGWRMNVSTRTLAEEIRRRMPPPSAIQATAGPEANLPPPSAVQPEEEPPPG